ncbi:MAG: hypothetical protein M5U26_19580 [Planctomycetota bacterium]|nr:hypothetical protein [Planctomycetota bacterium]
MPLKMLRFILAALALVCSSANADPVAAKPRPRPATVTVVLVQTCAGEGTPLILVAVPRRYAGGDPVNRWDPMGTEWWYILGHWYWIDDGDGEGPGILDYLGKWTSGSGGIAQSTRSIPTSNWARNEQANKGAAVLKEFFGTLNERRRQLSPVETSTEENVELAKGVLGFTNLRPFNSDSDAVYPGLVPGTWRRGNPFDDLQLLPAAQQTFGLFEYGKTQYADFTSQDPERKARAGASLLFDVGTAIALHKLGGKAPAAQGESLLSLEEAGASGKVLRLSPELEANVKVTLGERFAAGTPSGELNALPPKFHGPGMNLAANAMRGEGNFVYRGLALGEDAASGLVARAPGASNSVASHVAGKRASQWISTTRSFEIAKALFGEHGVVRIDLSKIGNRPVVDLTKGIPGQSINTMHSRWAINAQEVLIQGSIPPEAILPVQ